MTISSLLIANRGEIAIRIARAAADAGVRTVAVYSEDDSASLHVRRADDARALRGRGPAAYLDAAQIVETARDSGCDAVHPGYGFLSESAAFARLCAEAGLVFVGPRPEILDLFGDKARARELAASAGVPVLPGTGAVTLEEARAFLASLPGGSAVMVKAVAGGGGRGMRLVRTVEELADAYERCASEARAAFGSAEVYLEQYMSGARHIEVQVAGDGTGDVLHFWERECSIQRRHQKVVEIAPAPGFPASLRDEIIAAAIRLASEVRYDNIGTFEFLAAAGSFAFIEANARLQVEHTVTEEVTGIDLVRLQLDLASGGRLRITQAQAPPPNGHAIQLRINMERIGPDGTPHPAGGTITAFEPPSGPGVRVDTFGYAGYTTNPRFDPLLAKIIVHSPTPNFANAVGRARRALHELRVDGVETNAPVLAALLDHEAFTPERFSTGLFEELVPELWAVVEPAGVAVATAGRLAGARIDASDPLAVLQHGKSDDARGGSLEFGEPEPGAVLAPLQGTIVSIDVLPGDHVHGGQQLLVMEAMKMEHVIAAPASGQVLRFGVALGDAVFEGHPLVYLEESEVDSTHATAGEELDLDRIRPDLEEALARHAIGLDAARPDAVERRRKTGQRTARENIEDLCDAGTFIEYGPLVIAAQRRRRPVQELIEKTPADGLVGGIGSVNGALFDADRARCVLMSYDYTVLAGTQGTQNHRKKDRLFELAREMRLPIVFFAEGGGGRPGDTDGTGVAGLDCLAFNYYAQLSGLVPLVGITSGRCFAGNAALLGCCDVVIATRGSNIGMGGPAMIEGGGLGIFRPEEVGPMDVQVPNGVVDIPVEDEAEAVAVTRKYLSYFQGPIGGWECADQRRLRHLIPENRLRIYDVRAVIETMADTDSVLELRRHFGLGMVTALIRVEGRAVGVVANNPTHLAGAIDSDGADKAARFMQLCDAFDIPLLFLCDTPGIMVGPEIEKTGLVRHAARMFVTAANIDVPFFTIVLRKGYGLGAQAMAGGSFKAPIFTVAWPTGEFGGMGLEGAVKLGYRNELAAIADPEERRTTFAEMVDRMYQHGKAVNMASHFEIDDVIDPMESRFWITRALKSSPPAVRRDKKKRPNVDTW